MKTDLLPLAHSASSPREEAEAQRIVTIDFARRPADADRPLGVTRDTALPRPIGPDRDAGELPDGKPASFERPGALPPISQPLRRVFTWYSRRSLRRHFHSLRVSRSSIIPVKTNQPLVIYSNHASWWGPLVALLLAREFLPGKQVFAPMDAVALDRYVFLKRLGAFGVEPSTRRGAAQFLRRTRTILQEPGNALWLTPQSRFADVRERPVNFKAGIGHLPKLVGQLCFVPVAIEYVFWEDRLPEILVRLGESYETSTEATQLEPQVWTEFFAGRLADTQNALAAEARHRQPEKFRCLLRGQSGVGGIHDRWRAAKAKWRGQSFLSPPGKL